MYHDEHCSSRARVLSFSLTHSLTHARARSLSLFMQYNECVITTLPALQLMLRFWWVWEMYWVAAGTVDDLDQFVEEQMTSVDDFEFNFRMLRYASLRIFLSRVHLDLSRNATCHWQHALEHILRFTRSHIHVVC